MISTHIKSLVTAAVVGTVLFSTPAISAKVSEPMSLGELRVKIARLHVGKEKCSKSNMEFLKEHLQYYKHEGKGLKEHEYNDLSKKLDTFEKACKKAGFH